MSELDGCPNSVIRASNRINNASIPNLKVIVRPEKISNFFGIVITMTDLGGYDFIEFKKIIKISLEFGAQVPINIKDDHKKRIKEYSERTSSLRYVCEYDTKLIHRLICALSSFIDDRNGGHQ